MVTLGPLTAPERPGVVPALRAMCPARQVKGNLFTSAPAQVYTIFHLRHHFVSDLHQNMPALNFVAWKTGETPPFFKASYRFIFFIAILNQGCLPGVSPFSLSLLIPRWKSTSRQALPSLVSPCSLLHCCMESSMGRKELGKSKVKPHWPFNCI